MTELIYLTDSYPKELKTRVMSADFSILPFAKFCEEVQLIWGDRMTSALPLQDTPPLSGKLPHKKSENEFLTGGGMEINVFAIGPSYIHYVYTIGKSK